MAITAQSDKRISDGNCYPLGATLTEDGVNFALYTQTAREVYLLLFERPDGDPTDIIRLPNRTKFIWHVLVQGLKAGQLYGYKVSRRIRSRPRPALQRAETPHRPLREGPDRQSREPREPAPCL